MQDVSYRAGTFHPKPWTIWFTGLSGSGKSTLAKTLASYLSSLSLAHDVIDGDEIRNDLCQDLGFSKPDRDENIRRIGYLARLLNRHNIIAIVAAIAPYREARKKIRLDCSCFVEVYVDCSLTKLAERDVKGLYARALSGELPSFSGISDPYEEPIRPEIYINSEVQSEEESLALIITRLEELRYLPRSHNRATAKSLPA